MVFYEAVGDHKCGPEMRKQLNVPEEVCVYVHVTCFSQGTGLMVVSGHTVCT